MAVATQMKYNAPIAFVYPSLSPSHVSELANQFRAATPCPYVEINNFLTLRPSEVLHDFPDSNWPFWSQFQNAYQHQKMFCNDIDRIPPVLAKLILELCSPKCLQFLEAVTGITGLIPDPYLEGGGLHCSGPGGVLAPHTDFHIYGRLRLFRRVNLLVYLNEEWEQEFGGCLELYKKDSDVPVRTLVPNWGKCVIFRTDDKSVHGFSKPVVGQRWRRSIALYFYTSEDTSSFSGDADTHWKKHGTVSAVGKGRLVFYKGLMFSSRCFSRLAHRVNPHLGSRLVPVTRSDSDNH